MRRKQKEHKTKKLAVAIVISACSLVIGGGLCAYKDGQITQIFDKNISVTGVQLDCKRAMYVSDINGNIYRKAHDGDYVKIYSLYNRISKGVQLQ